MDDPIFLFGSIAVMIFSITTHEAAHGWVADRLGDPTPRLQGRITLNPIPHIDLFFTILLPALMLWSSGGRFMFGGAKPVLVDLTRLRNRWRDWALVGIAGPATNILLGFLFAGLFSFFVHTGRGNVVGASVLAHGVLWNFVLATFNLLPLPPLDGSRVIQYFLTPQARRTFFRFEQYGLYIILIMLLVFRAPIDWFMRTLMTPLIGIAGRVFGLQQEFSHLFPGF